MALAVVVAMVLTGALMMLLPARGVTVDRREPVVSPRGLAFSPSGILRSPRAHVAQRLGALPASARAAVSATLGGADPAYRVRGLDAANAAQGFDARFTSSGVLVRAGSARLSLALWGVGRGGTIAAARSALPRVSGNRVSYARGGISEWYVNGPLGLEQGFTVARRPAGNGSLVLAVRAGGSLRARVYHSGVVFAGPSGRVVLRYGGLWVRDARGRALRAWLSVGSGRVLVHVQDARASYPLRIDPFVQHGSKLVGTGASGAAEQGWSVAMSADGNTALIGGRDDDNDVGAAWVFTRSGKTWSQQGKKLVGTGASGAAGQGSSVALSADGSTALIGGPNDDNGVGAAWVFTRSGKTWSQQGKKLVGAGASGVTQEQGYSVALSADGDTALIGGPFDDYGAGAAWVFTRSGKTWSQQGKKLVGTGVAKKSSTQAEQGYSVALAGDGNTALIGGQGDNSQAGAAWVFTRSDETWSQYGSKLVGTGAVNPAAQGLSVALSGDGNTALIGGPGDDNDVGAAWVFGEKCPSGEGTVVTNTDDCGPGSLRQAIENVDSSTGGGTITFDIPGSGVQTITPATPLPAITEPVKIEGDTQGGKDYDGRPLIQLDGTIALGADGLEVDGGNSEVTGLEITYFGHDGIVLAGNGSDHVVSNLIGTDGTNSLGNGDGLVITTDDDKIEENVISGNRAGISIKGDKNLLVGNYVGTNLAGTSAVPNNYGIGFSQGSDNVLGGVKSGQGNLISGNSTYGVVIYEGHDNLLEGDTIGLNQSRTKKIANGNGGVFIGKSAGTGNAIGSEAGANTIAGNTGDGVDIDESTGDPILYNDIYYNSTHVGINLVDKGDADEHEPIVHSVDEETNDTFIIKGTAPPGTLVQVFINIGCSDPEGAVLDGSVTASSKGTWTRTTTDLTRHDGITATATNTKTENTSEFSNCLDLGPG